MKILTTIIIFIVLLAFLKQSASHSIKNANTSLNFTSDVPEFFGNQFTPSVASDYTPKRKGHYTAGDWRRAIDSVWGPGVSTTEKLIVFDKFWRVIDSSFACFHNITVNWDSLRNVYRTEVSNGVSRGRFAAIIMHLSLMLKESHTRAYDLVVSNTYLGPGVPLLVVGAWGINSRFGAALTPLPDSSLLVYEAAPIHPLGLRSGDIVLGYDRIPWRHLVRELIAAQLPMTSSWWWGSSESAFSHSFFVSAGLNWHLFDTIDIVKFSTGDTLHLSTAPLITAQGSMNLFSTEQISVPGVTKPNYNGQNLVSYGIIQGTNIGYIYGWGWFWNAESEFLNAVKAMMQTDGLIIDFRMNYGGNMFLSNPGLSLLFDTLVTTIDFGRRCNDVNHELMCPLNIPEAYVIPGSPPGYNKPIAVLTGPGALSSGDQVALRMKFHPHAKLFGKSTSAAFNAPTSIALGTNWMFNYARSDAYLVSNPDEYLTHRELIVDRHVWHTQFAATQGVDNVVTAARSWIDSLTVSVNPSGAEIPNKFRLHQNHPNPFNPVTTIVYEIPVSSDVKIEIFDMLGRKIKILMNEKKPAGSYSIDLNADGFASGIYIYKMIADQFEESKKLVVLK